MSGKIEVKIRLGKSLDKRYVGPSGTNKDGYPYWYLEVTDQSDIDKKVYVSPTWNDFTELIRDVRLHELRVDMTRNRKADADRWQEAIEKASEESQKQIQDYDIPDIYKKPKFIGDE